MRKHMKETLYLQNNDINIHMSASFGMAAYPEDADDREGLLAPLKVSF
jgi:predicted signal transduction protein with EAL and GGDEF domain